MWPRERDSVTDHPHRLLLHISVVRSSRLSHSYSFPVLELYLNANVTSIRLLCDIPFIPPSHRTHLAGSEPDALPRTTRCPTVETPIAGPFVPEQNSLTVSELDCRWLWGHQRNCHRDVREDNLRLNRHSSSSRTLFQRPHSRCSIFRYTARDVIIEWRLI